jgi:hypothetical protein
MNKLMVILEEVGIKAVEIAVREYVLGLLEGDLIGRASATKDCEDIVQIRQEGRELLRKSVRVMKKMLGEMA